MPWNQRGRHRLKRQKLKWQRKTGDSTIKSSSLSSDWVFGEEKKAYFNCPVWDCKGFLKRKDNARISCSSGDKLSG